MERIADWPPGLCRFYLRWWTRCRRALSASNAVGTRRKAERRANVVPRSLPSVTTYHQRRRRYQVCRSFRRRFARGCGKTFFWALHFYLRAPQPKPGCYALALRSRDPALASRSLRCAPAFGKLELFIFKSLAARLKVVP